MMLSAEDKGTCWSSSIRIQLLAGGTPVMGTDNFPTPEVVDPERELSGGWCTWRTSGLFFACWMSDVSEGVVSDTFLPGDAPIHGFGVIMGPGIFYTTLDAFSPVGRMAGYPMAIEEGDTFHLRTFYVDESGDTFIYSLDTTWATDPGMVEITVTMLDWATYYEDPTNPLFYCYPICEGAIEEGKTEPENYELAQNSPNPFNSATEIQYGIPQDADVSVEVYNIQGHKIKTLVTEHQSAGYYTVKWDGTDDSRETVASGTYFYRIRAGEYEAKKRMLYIK